MHFQNSLTHGASLARYARGAPLLVIFFHFVWAISRIAASRTNIDSRNVKHENKQIECRAADENRFGGKSDTINYTEMRFWVRVTRSAYPLYGKTGCSSRKINGTVHSNGNFPSKVLLFSRFDRFNWNFLYHLFALLVPGSSARARNIASSRNGNVIRGLFVLFFIHLASRLPCTQL